MARIRSVKPEFFKHLELNELEDKHPEFRIMLVYEGLWVQADKNGVFYYNSKVLKNEILPYVNFDITKSLDILEKNSFFVKYKSKNREYGYIPNFTKYQFPTKNEKNSPAKYPLPQEYTGKSTSEDVPGNDLDRSQARSETFSGTSDDIPENDTGNLPSTEGLQDNRIEGSQEKRNEGSNGSFSDFGFKYIPEEGQKTRENATTVFNKARALWNELHVPPECRDIIIPHTQKDILRTIQNYAWVEIENAIRNYNYHRTQCDNDWKPPPPFKSLYGFLKTGVEQYFNDDTFEKLFKEVEDGIRRQKR